MSIIGSDGDVSSGFFAAENVMATRWTAITRARIPPWLAEITGNCASFAMKTRRQPNPIATAMRKVAKAAR